MTASAPHPLYWDHCATTPTSPRVIEAMGRSLSEHFANPSSGHMWGARARDTVEEARVHLAELLGASARELIWTSGATEANNISIFGAASRAAQPIHMISQVTEHSAVLEPIAELERRGHQVTRLSVNAQGMIDLAELDAALKPETRLVTLMHANNEVGSLLPLVEVGELIRARAHPECIFHVDAAQSVGKIPINLAKLEVDLLSLSAHKFYGPKGVGALYIRRATGRTLDRRSSSRSPLRLPPLCLGGAQERGVRPGTLATHQIVGLGVAAREAIDDLADGGEPRLRALTQQLYRGLKRLDPQARRRSPESGAPHILSITLDPALLERIEDHWSHIAFSRGSACHSTAHAPSHVLLALGLSSEEASRTLRFGLGRSTTSQEVSEALQRLGDLSYPIT